MKKTGLHKLLALVIFAAMILGMIPGGLNQTVYADSPAVLNNNSTTWSADSTITDNVTIYNNVTVSGNITLTIPESKTLTVSGMINAEGCTVTVTGGGKLSVKGRDGNDVPDNNGYDAFKGNIIVKGADVIVTGGEGKDGHAGAPASLLNAGNQGPVYDGGDGDDGGSGGIGVVGSVTVYYGTVTVTGGNAADGRAGGPADEYNEKTKKYGKAGDGGNGGDGGAGVTGSITVYGGTATVTGGNGGKSGDGGCAYQPGTDGESGTDGSPGKAVGSTITGTTTEESDDNSAWSAVSGNSSTKQYIRAKAPVTMTVSAPDVTVDYDGKPHGIAVSVTVPASGATVRFKDADGNYTLEESPTITNVSDSPKTVYYQVTADNCTTVTGSAIITINKIDDPGVITPKATVAVGGNSINMQGYVTGAEGDVTFEITGDPSGCTLNSDWFLTSGDTTGTCIVTATIEESDNYNGKTGDIEVTITDKETQPLEVNQEDTVYGTALADPVWTRPAETVAEPVISYSGKTNAGAACGPDSKKPTEAGNYTVTVTEETMEAIYTGSADFTISRADSAVTAAPKAKEGLVSTGSAQELVEAGKAEGGEMQYAIGSDDRTAPDSGWSTAIPKGTDAKTYYVWYMVKGDPNHTDTAAACVTAVIAESEPIPDPEPDEPITSGGVLLAKVTAKGNNKIEVSWNNIRKAGGYDLYYGLCEGRNQKVRVITIPAGKTKYTLKNLKTGKGYKCQVKAWVLKNGEKKTISRSRKVRCVTAEDTTKYTHEKSVRVEQKNLEVAAGGKVKITASVIRDNPEKKVLPFMGRIRYISGNKSVATVDKDGKVRGVKAGTCKIYAIARNGVYKAVSVTVAEAPTDIRFRKNTYKVSAGSKLNLKKELKFAPEGAFLTLKWKSSNPAVATVDKNGKVKGISKGEVTITVTDTVLKKTITVTVKVR